MYPRADNARVSEVLGAISGQFIKHEDGIDGGTSFGPVSLHQDYVAAAIGPHHAGFHGEAVEELDDRR